MSPERWHKVTAIFHAALEQPSAEVDEFLRRQCGDDARLYSEVRGMLERHTQSGLLDRPAAWEAQPVFAAGEMVTGRYRITRFLGRGGMGEVYEAEDLDLKERVALKTLLPEIASDGRMIARFKQEIQLSRKIAHPNVCRVFDLARHPADGSTPQPVVFLTMELLAGETLAQKLQREHRLAPDVALPLLAQMAAALDAAHRAGVIHRDFKPSNVMLVDRATGTRAVVTDFGLARSLEGSGETTATETGKLMGTLDYMAPELLTGGTATVASDVYALGMTAYKMVTGALPFAAETPLAGAILRSKVPVPSARAAVPDLDPAFDRAVQRALDPEPARRFSSAVQFANALRGDAPSVTVKLPVMTRRRAAVAALVAILFLAAGVGWRTWIRSRNQPSAEALSFYSKGVDDIHAGAYFAATKALEQAVRLAPHYSLAHARLAEAWVELDVPEKAGQQMLIARREDASSLSALDRLQIEAVDLTITREFTSALGKYERIVSLGGDDSAGLEVDLGRAYEKAGQPSKATERYRQAAQSAAHPPAAWLRLAVLYSRASQSANAAQAFAQSEALYSVTSNLEGLTEVAYQRGIDANRRAKIVEAAEHLRKALDTARLAGNIQQEIRAELQLANNAYLAGESESAEALAVKALDTASANGLESLAISGIVNLGNAYLTKRDFPRAENYYQEALNIARHLSASRLAALSLLSLAGLHDQLKRSDAVASEAREALAYYQPNGFALESSQCLTLLGRVERNRGDYTAALETFHRSLEQAEKAASSPQMGLSHESIGSVLASQERYPEALDHYLKNLALSADAQHKGYAGLQSGNTLWRLGRYDEARKMFELADGPARNFASLRLNLMRARAEMALSERRFSDAATQARLALTSGTVENTPLGADLMRILGLALSGTGKKNDGLRTCERALAAATKLNDVDEVLGARLALSEARLGAGDREGALFLLRDGERVLADHPESRWRAFALMGRVEPQYVRRATEALTELGSLWGDSAYQVYLTRPDVNALSWPLLHRVSANQ